jgi:O-methyltransferase involved in polyketide biosynthesis
MNINLSGTSVVEINININDISETAFLTLQCHALDAQSPRPFLNDVSAIRTMDILKACFLESDRLLYKRLLKDKVKSNLVAHTALRAKKYDSYIRNFLDRFPDAAVINIGCGLDNRFERVDNGRVTFYDLDLPDIINIKRQIFPGMKLLEDWSCLDSNEPNSGIMRLMGRSSAMRKVQWTVYYILGRTNG